MDNVSKTLYIPLYGKALVSRIGILLHDPKAEQIWSAEGFPLKGKSASKWLAYYMSMRAAVFDDWLREQVAAHPGATVLHLGCGMDSRCLRVQADNLWYDVDFPDVISRRRKHFPEQKRYHMLGCDLRQEDWLEEIGAVYVTEEEWDSDGTVRVVRRRLSREESDPTSEDAAIVVMEGISMYLTLEELSQLVKRITRRFSRVYLLMDCYSQFAAQASRYKNPINDVGVSTVYGMDDPEIPGLVFLREHDMTPDRLICQLTPWEQRLFRKLYAGSFARSLYRLYEYEA